MQQAGCLYIVPTPIGNLEDISPRAIDVLKTMDIIAAEDTRHSGKLLKHFGIESKLIAYHQHNEKSMSEGLISQLVDGKNIALISDAGTPLISDPGHCLTKQAHENNIQIIPIPGPCALITALSASGLSATGFQFMGFLPAKSSQRISKLKNMVNLSHTLIFYESPHRILSSLEDMMQCFGEHREAVLARELTKVYESIIANDLLSIYNQLKNNPEQQQGEMVILISGNSEPEENNNKIKTEFILENLLSELPLKQAVRLTAAISGEKKNKIYSMALEKQQTKAE